MSPNLWRALAAVPLLVAGLGCSRPSGDGSGASASSTPAAPPLAAPSLSPQAPSATPSDRPVLTPEDAEDAAERRITDQNLESELDRLEREIQGE